MRYDINAPMVITDDMDGEIIILNTESGKYFSAEKTGMMMWEMLSGGYTSTEVAELFTNQFSLSDDVVTTDVNTILTQLNDEGLLKESKLSEPSKKVDLTDLEEYKTPKILAYSDMEKLLLMDPVHEVEKMGWPNVKKQ